MSLGMGRTPACTVMAVIATVVAACACKSGTGGGAGTGTGPGTSSGTGDPSLCPAIAAHVEDLYRANAERTGMTEGEVADNVAMVLADCRAQPGRVAPCAQKVTSVVQLESRCLIPLDDVGSEGLGFAR